MWGRTFTFTKQMIAGKGLICVSWKFKNNNVSFNYVTHRETEKKYDRLSGSILSDPKRRQMKPWKYCPKRASSFFLHPYCMILKLFVVWIFRPVILHSSVGFQFIRDLGNDLCPWVSSVAAVIYSFPINSPVNPEIGYLLYILLYHAHQCVPFFPTKFCNKKWQK